MKTSFENIHETKEQPKTREEYVAQKIFEIENKFGKPITEVLEERGKILEIIAKMVGKNFNMKVRFGEIGKGSYFSPEDESIPREDWNSITLDPLILAEIDGIDEFVAAHEGAHRAITITLEQSGLKTKQEREKYTEKVGWNFIYNTLEDPAVNNWVSQLYQRIAEILKENYNKQFEQEGAVMSTPQVQEIIETLGYVPDFVKYGSEIMRYWHNKSFSCDLSQDVLRALQSTKMAAGKFWSEIPYIYPTEKDIFKKGKTRWQIYEKYIWPHVQKLIGKDLIDEKLKQYLKDQLEEVFKQAEKQKQEQKEQPQQGTGQSIEDIMDQFGFDEKEKQEMREKMQEAEERQQENLQKLKAKLQNGEISQEEFDEKNQEAQENLPINIKSLSESAKKKIEQKLSQESKDKQSQIEEGAKESLKKAEDRVNKDVQGKIGPKEESHKERKDRQKKEAEESHKKAQKIIQELAEKKKQNDAFDNWQKERELERTDWENAVSEQAKTIDELYSLIENLFQKTKSPSWKKGFSDGQRLDLGMAMQYEADPRNYTRLWNKKTIPEKYDYKFALLNDQSGSMREGNKAKNDLIAKAITTEVLAALGVPCEILGFTTPSAGKFENYVEVYKDFDEDINKNREKIQQNLSKIIKEGGGKTPTFTATQIASAKLAEQREQTKNQAHFLIVISDGEPFDDPQDSSIEGLKNLNEHLSKENNQVIIGMGIGDGISEEKLKTAYGSDRYVYAKNPEEFPIKMAALLEAIFTQSQIKK